MIEATTPTIALKLPNTVDLSLASSLFVTFRQQSITITKTLSDGVELSSAYELLVTLNQADTLRFVPKFPVEVQVNWIVGNSRFATKIKNIGVLENLIPEVISG